MYEAFIQIMFTDGTSTVLNPGVVFPTFKACIVDVLSNGAFALLEVDAVAEIKATRLVCQPAGELL